MGCHYTFGHLSAKFFTKLNTSMLANFFYLTSVCKSYSGYFVFLERSPMDDPGHGRFVEKPFFFKSAVKSRKSGRTFIALANYEHSVAPWYQSVALQNVWLPCDAFRRLVILKLPMARQLRNKMKHGKVTSQSYKILAQKVTVLHRYRSPIVLVTTTSTIAFFCSSVSGRWI